MQKCNLTRREEKKQTLELDDCLIAATAHVEKTVLTSQEISSIIQMLLYYSGLRLELDITIVGHIKNIAFLHVVSTAVGSNQCVIVHLKGHGKIIEVSPR